MPVLEGFAAVFNIYDEFVAVFIVEALLVGNVHVLQVILARPLMVLLVDLQDRVQRFCVLRRELRLVVLLHHDRSGFLGAQDGVLMR